MPLKEINWDLIEFKEKFVLELLDLSATEMWSRSNKMKISEARRLFFILTERDCRQVDLIEWIYSNRGFVISGPNISYLRGNVGSNPLFRLLLKMYEEISGEKYYLKALKESRKPVRPPKRKYIKKRL